MLTGLMHHAGEAVEHLDVMQRRIQWMADAELAAVITELAGEEPGDKAQLVASYCQGEAARRFLKANLSSDDA